MFVFRKTWHALFFCNNRLEIALLPYYRRLYIHFKLATLVFSTGITWEHQPDALKYSVVIISNEQVNDL